MHHKRQQGFSLVELLIAVGVMGIILAFIGAFFNLQARTSRDQQARSSVQTAARTIGDMIAQDFQLVGSSAVAFPDGSGVAASAVAGNLAVYQLPCFDVSPAACFEVSADDTRWRLTYLSSLWLSEPLLSLPTGNVNAQIERACRTVEYVFSEDQILRADFGCLEFDEDWHMGDDDFSFLVADGVQLVDLTFFCAVEGTARTLADAGSSPLACYDDDSFVRSVEVLVEIEDPTSGRFGQEYAIAASTPNLRPAFSLVLGDQ